MGGIEAFGSAASGITAAIALVVTWMNWRKTELRRDDVLLWGIEAIKALESLLIITIDDVRDAPAIARVTEIRFSSAALVEQGRLFFRNAHPDRYGTEKEPAYRGFRPCILDELVIAYGIATKWPSASDKDQEVMRLVAEGSLKKFVSLLQKEVGRERTASADTRQGGSGSPLQRRMIEIEQGQRAA